jgi:hypothetical protein
MPGSQALGYASQADELFYGGQAGGGKTDLLLGLAGTRHKKTIIFRREYPQLQQIEDRGKELFRGRAEYNGTKMIWRFPAERRQIELGAVQQAKDVDKYQGRPHDLICFDEITHFSEYQYRFLIAWNRTSDQGQRCRVVCTGNPPQHEEGEWVMQYWAPWLDRDHPHYPEQPGKLRWYVSDEHGIDREVQSGDPVAIDGQMVQPLSRTFIPASVDDNPFYAQSGYKARLQALPEPLRSMLLKGEFGHHLDKITGQAYSSFSRDNLHPVAYDPARPVRLFLDFNRRPAVCGFAHDLESGEYPEGNDAPGAKHLGVFGVIFNRDGCDVQALSLAILNGKMPDGSPVPGWHLPDNFKGLSGHQHRVYLYGDASGRQRTAASEASLWAQLIGVLSPALGKRLVTTLQVPQANPPVHTRLLAVNTALWNPYLGIRTLWIDERCKPLVTDLERVRVKPDGSGIEKVTKESDSRFYLTHISDGLGYLLNEYAPPSKAMIARRGGMRYADSLDFLDLMTEDREHRPAGNLAEIYR